MPIYYPEVKYDPAPESNAFKLREEEKRLENLLENAKERLHLLTTRAPEEYPDIPAMIRGLPQGVYIGKAGNDLANTARNLKSIVHQADLDETIIDSMYKAASTSALERVKRCLAELDIYLDPNKKEKPGIGRRLSMIADQRFRMPGAGILSAVSDSIDLLVGSYTGIWLKANAQKGWQIGGYPLDDFPKAREELGWIWGETRESDGVRYPEFLDFRHGFRGAEFFRERGFSPEKINSLGLIAPSQKRRDEAVYSAGPAILYHLSKRLKEFRSGAERDVENTVQEIKRQHPEIVRAWSEGKQNAKKQLRAVVENSEGWERAWRVNYDGVQRCEQRKVQAINDPWLRNQHPIYNTSAYSAKLTGLSVQLEAIQGGVVSPNLRLLT